MIERIFQDVPEGKISEADQQTFLLRLGWSQGAAWNDLMRSKRVLIISEAGAGKTHECRHRAKSLWDAGEAAFFVELAALATSELRSLLDNAEEARFAAWLSSQSDVATFFLDSIDELKLTSGSFEQAIKRLKKAIDGHLGRVRVVITTRPIPFDEQLIRQQLPVPPVVVTVSKEEAFAKIAMRDHPHQEFDANKEEAPPDFRTVALMPLSDDQIIEFARDQGISDPTALLTDLQKRNAQEFARRPQDLIELCADWREHKRIRTHRDQVIQNVWIKLQPRDDRAEPAELSVQKATEGASRLALAMMATRCLTVRHSAAADINAGEGALDPAIVLPDWTRSERQALLERPLFGFASYGRVRFHHRSVAEFLAAERLRMLRERGMPFRALKRLLFAESKGKTIVRPSKRPIAAWLALVDSGIFEILRDHEPSVLLNEGDPESLTVIQRNQVLRAYVTRYGQGGWRGLRVPDVQIHRFTSPELSTEIGKLWKMGIENPDVQRTILQLIELGPIRACSDIANDVAWDPGMSVAERVSALDAMIALKDSRLMEIAHALSTRHDLWENEITCWAILRMFPHHISTDQLCQALSWIKYGKGGYRDVGEQLATLIKTASLELPQLESLRDGLVKLVSDGLHWRDEWPHIVSNRSNLAGALAAVCSRGIALSKGDEWYQASALALRLRREGYGDRDAQKVLQKQVGKFNASENAHLFWALDSLVQCLHSIEDPWGRLSEITYHNGPLELRADRDLEWIKESLGDKSLGDNDRAMLLEVAMRLRPSADGWRDHVERLKPLVSDNATLVSAIDKFVMPSKQSKQYENWEKKEAERRRQRDRKRAKDHASWVQFWREVALDPEKAFSTEQSYYTAWNLWRAMSQDGADSRTSGWNRRLIEEQFGKATADLLRQALMGIWRKERPTLPSERAENERNTYLVRWQLGLAAIYAEAEDSDWATNLSDDEAKLAARFALIELNGLPHWMEGLIKARPQAVDAVLGSELSWGLKERDSANGHSMLLQSISYASSCVARLFLPRLECWLTSDEALAAGDANLVATAERYKQVIGTLVQHGDQATHTNLLSIGGRLLKESLPSELAFVWLPAVMRINPEIGVSALEERLATVQPSKRSEAVTWFAQLFGYRSETISLKNNAFTPAILLRLLRLAYQHVRTVDDANREGSYSPDMRDHAETARSEIVNAVLSANGEEGWSAKLEMANDPFCIHFKDRILAVAEEHWAEEIDSVAFTEAQAVALDRVGEAPASTNEAMFAIMNDRLADLDDLLLRDSSPREAWANIADEKLMRREIARELGYAANGLYKVDQEAVTADEKETDIRLRSTASDYQAVIELKLADSRSARDLRDTIYEQLVKKYMASDHSRSGCLLMTLAKDRNWEDPDSGKPIGLDELQLLLRNEAQRVEEAMGGSVALSVHLLNLRPRLSSKTGK